jgi:hypothetical protein
MFGWVSAHTAGGTGNRICASVCGEKFPFLFLPLQLSEGVQRQLGHRVFWGVEEILKVIRDNKMVERGADFGQGFWFA